MISIEIKVDGETKVKREFRFLVGENAEEALCLELLRLSEQIAEYEKVKEIIRAYGSSEQKKRKAISVADKVISEAIYTVESLVGVGNEKGWFVDVEYVLKSLDRELSIGLGEECKRELYEEVKKGSKRSTSYFVKALLNDLILAIDEEVIHHVGNVMHEEGNFQQFLAELRKSLQI